MFQPPQKGVGAGRYVQVFGQACARLAAQGEADSAMGVGQAVGGTGMDREQAGKAFTEDGL
jgi:hypothetical protein